MTVGKNPDRHIRCIKFSILYLLMSESSTSFYFQIHQTVAVLNHFSSTLDILRIKCHFVSLLSMYPCIKVDIFHSIYSVPIKVKSMQRQGTEAIRTQNPALNTKTGNN